MAPRRIVLRRARAYVAAVLVTARRRCAGSAGLATQSQNHAANSALSRLSRLFAGVCPGNAGS